MTKYVVMKEFGKIIFRIRGDPGMPKMPHSPDEMPVVPCTFRLPFRSQPSLSGRVRRARARTTGIPRAMDVAQTLPMRLFIKGENGARGDCPFSQFVLLLLEEMGVPYAPTFEDFDHKSEELLRANPSGEVPVLITPEGPVPDSARIADWLSSTFPEASLPTQVPESCATAASAVFPAFVKYLKGSGQAGREEFEAALASLESHLQETPGHFLAGEAICRADLQLIPKLYHATVALQAFKGWELERSRFPSVSLFMDVMMKRPSWECTKPPTEGHVVRGWASHVAASTQL